MPRRPLVATAATLLVLAAGCSSDDEPAADDGGEVSTDDATSDGDRDTFTFGPDLPDPDEVRPPSEPVALGLDPAELSDEVPDVDACTVLTGDELGDIVGEAVEALTNDGVCAYTVAGQAVALLEVTAPATTAERFEELAAGGPARADVVALDVGDAAIALARPEERVIVIAGDAGFEFGSATGNAGWSDEQLADVAAALEG